MFLKKIYDFFHPKNTKVPQELGDEVDKLRAKIEKERKKEEKLEKRVYVDAYRMPSAKSKAKKEKESYLEDSEIVEAKEIGDSHYLDFEAQALSSHSYKLSNNFKSAPLEKTFQELLFEHIDKKKLTDSEVYNKALVDRRTFSKIRSNKNYHPSKGTIIQLALALELSIDDALKLLKASDYYLTKNTVENLVIYYVFEHNIYNIIEANNLLYTVCNRTIDKL